MGEQPDHGPDWEGTARELESTGRFEDAAEAWGELARQNPAGAARARALVCQARRLGSSEQTERLYRRALVNDPSNADAVEALTALARSNGSATLLGNLHRLRFSRETDAGSRAEIALAAGRLELEQLHSPGAARSWFRDGLECEPTKIEIVDAIVDLERRRGDEAVLLVSLERLIELREADAAPSELLEAAALRAARGEQARALAHLERASSRAPEDALVLEALAEVLAALDRLPDLADVLERRAAIAADDPELRAAVLAELAALQEERLFDPEAALDAFQRAYAADPRAPGLKDAIARLRAKLESDAPNPLDCDPDQPPDPAHYDAALAKLEREARTNNDRGRLPPLVREIVSLHHKRGTPDLALPWVQRWALASPEDPEALQALARIHEQPGHEAKLTATLEALDPLLDLDEQASNRRKLAALYESRGLLDDAVRSYERALSIEPRDLETLQSLQSLLRDRRETGALVGVLQRILELLEPRRRAAALIEIAEIQEDAGDVAGAILTRERLQYEDHVPADSEERLDALLGQAGRHEEIEQRLCQRRERFEVGSAEAVAIELRRAHLLHNELSRPEDAAAAFRNVLEHAPESPEAKTGLERALRASIDASGLADFLACEAEATQDPAIRERAYFERAVLLEEVLDRVPEAREAYRQLTTSATQAEMRRDAAYRYDRLLQVAGEWDALREHLEASLGGSEPAEEAALHERLARLCGEQLRDEPGELLHLERVVELDPSRADVWRALSDRYEHENRPEDQIRAMEKELAAGCDLNRRLTLHARLAEFLLNTRKDPVAAHEHFERVFEIDPSHAGAAQFLIGRYDRDRRPEEVIRVLESRIVALDESTDDGASEELKKHRTALRVHVANVRASQLDDVEGAISALELALGEVGPTPQVAEPLATCYQRAGYTLDLIELSRAAAAACTEPAEAANWFVRMGDSFLARELPREAADAYRQALSERPDDRAVQASLRAIYRRLEQHESLASLLDAELTHLAGPDEIPVRMEMAALQAQQLGRAQDALLHAQRVLQLAPRHAEAFELSIHLASELNRHDLALDAVETRLEHAGTGSERAELLAVQAALLAEPAGRPDEAIECLRASLGIVHDEGRRQALADLLERQGRTTEWLEVIGEQARGATAAERAQLLERAARAAWDRISPDAALPWLERLAVLRGDDVEVLLRIGQAHRGAGRTESLLRSLSEAVARTKSPIQRRNLQLERAALLELEMNAPSRALLALQDARAAAPDDAEVLGRLERIQSKLSRHADRAETLSALLAVTPEDALELHCELARLRAGPLFDPAGAIAHWRAAYASAPVGSRARIQILHSLAEAYRRAGDFERWARTAEDELATLDAAPVFDDRRREIRRELALGYFTQLARPGAALRHARALLDAGEDDLLGGETLDRLESMLLALLRQAGAPIELEARLTRHLARRPEQAQLWLELARVREEQLQSTASAIDAYNRCLELDPTCLPALRGLRAAAERLGRYQDVAGALARELEHPETEDPEIRSGLLRRLGDVYWHRLQSTTRASRCYAGALEVNAADFAALRALERLLEAMEDWRGALDLYESEVEVLGDSDPQRRREIWLHVATLARDRTDDVERARRAMGRAAAIESLQPPELRELAELHARAGDDDAFAETFGQWCEADGAATTAEDEVRLAICMEGLGRSEEALACVERAIQDGPTTPDAWDVASRLREALGDPLGAADALCAAADRAPDREAAARLLHASKLAEERDAPRALELLRGAVARDPCAAVVQTTRARLALRTGALADAEEAAAAVLDLDAEALAPAERLEIALVGGDAARAAGRLEVAAGFYARACESDPQDPAATGRFGETLAELGDMAGAREALQARLSVGDRYPERAAHQATLALCFETEEAHEDALDAALAALEDDPRNETALGARVRMHESLGHLDEMVTATLRWAAAADEPTLRAERLLRAAEWELRSGEREASAEAHVREALVSDPDLPAAWVLLVSLLTGQGRLTEAIDCADRAACHAPADEDLGLLALLQGRAYEQHGDRSAAAAAFGVAAEAEPRCAEAALAQARLLRGAGEWRAAAEALQSFLDAHPESGHSDLGEVHEQLARLLAGPLEDVEGAVVSYRRAIQLAPAPLAPRAALAELLSHRADDRAEALIHLQDLLDADPTDVSALRVALRLARNNPAGAGVAVGIEVLRALGLASAYEREEALTLPDLALPSSLGRLRAGRGSRARSPGGRLP
jgi:tetratricopeptide (TPR) repeat protein